MTKQERMRLLLIDVRAYLRNTSMDAVYEKGRREGLLDAINDVLSSADEPSVPFDCKNHVAAKCPTCIAVWAGTAENRNGDV